MPKELEPKDIREMADADIQTKVTELEEERFRLEFRSATETLDDPLRLRWLRRDVARLKTVLRERGLQSKPGAGAGAAHTTVEKGSGKQKEKQKRTKEKTDE
jgi:large subunit ribosomal protein L29